GGGAPSDDQEDHQHDGDSCGCGHDHEHEHHHHDGDSCGCGHDHEHHHHDGDCCDHDHDHAAAAQTSHHPLLKAGSKDVQQYELKGLTCAHCAATIEHEVQGWSDVNDASLDLMKGTLTIASPTAADEMFQRVTKCVNSVESGVTVLKKALNAPRTAAKAPKGGLASLWDTSRREVIEFALAAIVMIIAKFVPDGPVQSACYVISYLIVGLPVLKQAFKAAAGGFIFNEQMLMGVASLGAMAVGQYAEGVAVMLFYTLGELLQELAVNRSKHSIASLIDMRPDSVRVQTQNGWQEMAPEEVGVGAMIQVQPGERIALDGVVVTGSARLDTSAVTGESRPFDVAAGDTVQSGSVNEDGVLVIRVAKAYGDSTLSRILSLVEDASARKAPTERFITRFARYYTPIVVALAVLVAIIPPLAIGGDWSTWIYRGLVFLVVSCPCALVISVPLTYFAGIGGASRQHILVKGSQYLETLAKIKQVAFDKTGTLTRGDFSVAQVINTAELDSDKVLHLAASLEQYAAHPLAEGILKAVNKDVDPVDNYHNIAGQGVSADINGETYYLGNLRLMKDKGIAVDESKIPVGTTVLLADSHKLLGIILMEDTPKEGVREAMKALRQLGVEKTVILSGDTPEVAQRLANELHMDEVHGGLLPADKIDCVEKMMQAQGGNLAFVGDGVNDAPVLARADVGIAMGGVGSDAAIEAADVVLMSDHPKDVVKAIRVARKTRAIAIENVVGALALKGVLMILAAIGLANMWMAVFADVGVCIICVFNAMRAMIVQK
ncbi:MAG: heavy metal translocating P-type ATPase, partial [Peptococcaceae bacterium]|nr:heavy metal translocating P-type ATPase [Peptococcaceae bacterium]